MSKIQFSVSYEYQNSSIGEQIFQGISRDFSLPGWIEKVYEKEYQKKFQKEFQKEYKKKYQKEYQNESQKEFQK